MSGCLSAYYSTMEKFGVEKRDILVDRVEEAKEAQHDASEQFESALEQFTDFTQFKGGDLQEQYTKLKKSFEKSESRAEKVKTKIEGVEKVGTALFKEWKAEIAQYSDPSFKTKSQANLKQTQSQYNRLLSAMKKSESRIDPVLDAFRDRVLYLKHNLNARALSSLQGDLASVKSDVSLLIKDMQTAIKEADGFIQSVK